MNGFGATSLSSQRQIACMPLGHMSGRVAASNGATGNTWSYGHLTSKIWSDSHISQSPNILSQHLPVTRRCFLSDFGQENLAEAANLSERPKHQDIGASACAAF